MIGLDLLSFLSVLPFLCVLSMFISSLRVLIETSSVFSYFLSFTPRRRRQFRREYCSKSFTLSTSNLFRFLRFSIFSSSFRIYWFYLSGSFYNVSNFLDKNPKHSVTDFNCFSHLICEFFVSLYSVYDSFTCLSINCLSSS